MYIKADDSTVRIGASWERLPTHLIERFRGVPASIIADAFDRLLVMDSAIAPVTSHTQFVGSALPILTRAGDNLAIHRALDDASPGDVLVIAGQGDESRAVIGDLIGEIMRIKGVVGAIVDGAARDAEALDAQGLSVFARALTPAGPFKYGPGVIGDAVACGGVVVGPGDLIVADADGVSVIPAARAQWAADRLHAVIANETALRQRIIASAPAPTPAV